MFPVYSESPTRGTEPFAVTDGKFKAHFYTRGSGKSLGVLLIPNSSYFAYLFYIGIL